MVPQWYYKVIVDYHQPVIKAIAFIIPNHKPQKSLRSFAVSIDKLEEMTQLDFLDKLTTKQQQQLESTVDLSKWKLPVTKKEKAKVENQDANAVEKYWITTSSKKRHNASCRYYRASKGRLGPKDEGIACKICGGWIQSL